MRRSSRMFAVDWTPTAPLHTFMRTRAEAIADAIAKRIMANTKKRFSTLHADAIMETNNMSTPTSSTLNGDGKGQPRPQIGRPQVNSPVELAFDYGKGTAPAGPDTNLGMAGAQNSEVVVGPIKPVDFKTIEGSYPGDHRSQAAPADTDQFKNSGDPRSRVKQFRDNSKLPDGPAPISYLGAEGTDQN